jgi:AcrR family transcriptional regulator
MKDLLKMARQSITREGLIEATVKVIHDKGVAGATTRAIVQAVPCAEGTLYLYFKRRTDLILAVIEHSASSFVEDLKALPQYVGQGTVEENLLTIIQKAAIFQEDVLTLLCGVVSDPELLRAQQDLMRKARKGPHLSRLAIAGYLEAEKANGRVSVQLNSEMVAGLLLRTSFGRVFEERFAGTSSDAESGKQMKALIASLLVPRDQLIANSNGTPTKRRLNSTRKARP